MAWNLGTNNIDSTTTGSLFVGPEVVKKVYQGQLQVYPDFVPFPNTTIYDRWIADVGATGTINSKVLKKDWYGSGGDIDTFTAPNGFKYFVNNPGGVMYPDEGETYWQSNGGCYQILVGNLASADNFWTRAALGWNSQIQAYNEFSLTGFQEPLLYEYTYTIEQTSYTSATGSWDNDTGMMMNVVDNNRNAGSGSREVYLASSTPDVSQVYNFNLGFPGKKPRARIANTTNTARNPFIYEYIILLDQPSTAELDEYRQYVSAKYGITA